MKTKDLIHRAMMLERSMALSRENRAHKGVANHFIENARAHVAALPKIAQADFGKLVDDLAREIALPRAGE